MKSLGRKFILWTNLPPFTGSLGDWRIDWQGKKVSSEDSIGRMRKASTLSYGTKFCLSLDEKTPCVKGEAFEVEHVRKAAEHILEGLTIDTSILTLGYPGLIRISLSAPPVKSEISEVLNAITMMGQNLQMVLSASQMASRPGPRLFIPATGQSDFSRQIGLDGAAGNKFNVSRISSFPQPLSCLIGVHPGRRLSEMRRTWSCLAVETLFLPIQTSSGRAPNR